MSGIVAVIEAIVHRLDRTRGTPPSPGDHDYIAPGATGYVPPPAPGDPGYVAPLPSFIGEKFKAQHDAPPRLVWVPTRDTFGPPIRIGAVPRAVRTRMAGVDVDFWAVSNTPGTPADLTAAESLLEQLLVALHQEMRIRYGAGDWYANNGVEWHTEGQLVAIGYGGTLSLVLTVPVAVGAPASVRLETLTLNEEIDPWQPTS